MLPTLITSVAIALLPTMAHAQIYSRTSASSDSGGNAVGPGGRVVTGGASASVSASTINGTSSSSVYIRTDSNGVVHEESYTSPSSDMSVSVQSTPKETVIETKAGDAPAVRKVIPAAPSPASAGPAARAHASADATSAPAAAARSAKEPPIGLGAKIFMSIQGFFAAIFRWL